MGAVKALKQNIPALKIAARLIYAVIISVTVMKPLLLARPIVNRQRIIVGTKNVIAMKELQRGSGAQ